VYRAFAYTTSGPCPSGKEAHPESCNNRINCIPTRVTLLIEDGGQRRDRTADAGLFRAALYH
jgi:hypothetical protein